MTKDLRLELRVRNNVLWHAIFDQHKSVSAFCRQHEISQQTVGGYLNLTESPYRLQARRIISQDQEPAEPLHAVARKLCIILGYTEEALFPPALYQSLFPLRSILEVESAKCLPLAAARHLALPPTQNQDVLNGELRATVDQLVKTLTPREEIVLRRRFGLGGQEEQTCGEIGEDFGLSKTRIAQIEARALTVLRRRSWKRLRNFMA